MKGRFVYFTIFLLLSGTFVPYIIPDMDVPVVQAAWWDGYWAYKKQITLDHDQVLHDLTNFPVLINLSSDTSLAAHARNDAYDICFVDSTETVQFAHEIEYFDGSTGQLVAWVNVSSVSSTVLVIPSPK